MDTRCLLEIIGYLYISNPIDIVINYKPLVNCLLIDRLLVFL